MVAIIFSFDFELEVGNFLDPPCHYFLLTVGFCFWPNCPSLITVVVLIIFFRI